MINLFYDTKVVIWAPTFSLVEKPRWQLVYRPGV